MTLSPTESRDVKGVPAEKYRINAICAHPFCAQNSDSTHHCFRRSIIVGDSYFVSIDGSDPIPHAVGLCNEHHRQVTDNAAWIRFLDDPEPEFVWLDHDGYEDDRTKRWEYVGELDPQPGQLSKGKKRRKQGEGEEKERKPSRVLGVRCPADESEDGIALLRELIELARIKIGRPEGCPSYYILMEVLAVFLRDASASE